MNQKSHSPMKNVRGEFPLECGPQLLVEKRAALSPDSLALVYGNTQLSYRELNEKANQLAHFLRAQGTVPGKIIGVLLDRSEEMVICLLGILKAGAVYLPLDPKFPKDRLAFMLSDAEVSILLTQADLQDTAPSSQASIVSLETLASELKAYSTENPEPVNVPQDTAYVIYTSGSTGNPKGVMVPRRALINFLMSMSEKPGMSENDVLLAITTISFDISLLEMLLPLTVGARIVVAARAQVSDPSELRRLLDEHHVTAMQGTPTTWRLLLESGWAGKKDLKILCGGEALTSDLAERLLPRCSELWNMYGPTETTIWSSTERVMSADAITLGLPIANTSFVVVDEQLHPVSVGETGELLIGGEGLARGYLKREELTAQKFIPDTISGVDGARFYRTGDEVRYKADDTLEFLGRLDHQVKLNGFRIELGEIESALNRIEGVRQAVVILREDTPGDKRLVAYYAGSKDLDTNQVLSSLRSSLPEYMVPSAFVWMEEFPQTPNAKLDRKALPAPARKRPLLAQEYIAPFAELEKQMAALWQELLHVDQIGIDDSFFDLGGNSIAVFRMVSAYRARFNREIPPVKVFQYPTIAQLCGFLAHSEGDPLVSSDAQFRTSHRRAREHEDPKVSEAIAVVGMVGRFPGADNLDKLWSNLCEGRESISFFTPEELGPGIDERLRNASDYIRARGIIEGADLFDAGFFGISTLEAQVMDPQQRVFLELAYNALENAGYDPGRYRGSIGVYAGIGDNHYYTTNLLTHPDLLARAGKLTVEYGNQKDYIALRLAYLLDLRGPAVSMNTACSTTLLAIDLAYRALLDYECDVALAGGIDITVPQKSGFPYTEGGTFARDGHCRPFDAEATGTMFCDGAGIVVLKRLSEALKDGDRIYSVLHGTGKNNNGARPASFLAPSAEGQAEAVAMAQANASIDVEKIGYIEAHGTGTPVGDPIEIEALNSVFRRKTKKTQYCHIGSIKGNVGHPTNAAGVAGFIKASMVLDREQIPPTLHYKTPNPRINFLDSPFIVADKLVPYQRGEQPRFTAVSSFGFGGTNVHAILGEAPVRQPGSVSRPLQLFPISARTATSLDALSAALATHFQTAPADELADAAFTLQTGRKQMAMRRFVVAADSAEAARLFQQPDPRRCATKRCDRRDPPVAFLFCGQGTQYVNMGKNLYAGEPFFRAIVDDCCETLKPHLGRDLRDILYPPAGQEEAASTLLQDTCFTQPALFVIEYALARLWQSFGIQPAMMVGHSIGEFVAATMADVWDLSDALRIVALRGRLMQARPRGTMMSVRASSEEVSRRLPPEVQIASNNAPTLCVVSGPDEHVQALRQMLEAENILCRPLHTSHAFHSAMMDDMVEPLRAEVAKVNLRAPSRPFVSTVTGQVITAAEATSPEYWAHQARATVEFSVAVRTLKKLGHTVFLECGPRSTLCSLVRQHFELSEGCVAIPSFGDTHEDNQEWASVLFALGSLWLNGASVDWDAFYAQEFRRRVPLPLYPFERQRYWVDPATTVSAPVIAHAVAASTVAAPRQPESVSASASTRKERLTSRLLDLIAPISGHQRDELSSAAMFVEQGFDSLSLVQVSVQIEQEFGFKFGFSKLMNQFPTVEMVAAHLDEVLPAEVMAISSEAAEPASAVSEAAQPLLPGLGDASIQALAAAVAEQARVLASIQETLARITVAPAAVSVSQRTLTPPLPAKPIEAPTTAPQRGIYYSSRLSQNLSGSYNESVTLHIDGQVSVPKIKRALERLVERHDALRAVFDPSGSSMRIEPHRELAIPVQDISSSCAPLELQEKLKAIALQEAALPFQLPEGPFLRCSVVLMGSASAAVILTVHHIICDGWSIDVLIQDFCAFYSEELSGPGAAMAAAPNFADYARHSDERAHSPEFRAARAYWEGKFAGGLPALSLPADFPRKALREHRAIRVDRTIGSERIEKLRSMAAENGCSLFAVSVSALAILLARLSRQARFVLALSTAEQPFLGQPGLVGHCVSLLPFVVELDADEDATTFMRRVQKELAEAMDHLSFTTIHLMEELVSSSRTRMSPIPVGLTGIKKFRPDELDLRGFRFDYEGNPKSFESFEWYLSAMESAEGLEMHGHYDVELFRNDTIERWLEDFEKILLELGERPATQVFDLARFTAESTPVEGQIFTWAGRGQESLDTDSASNAAPVHGSAAAQESQPLTADAPTLLPHLVKLYQRVLGIRTIAPDDNFFDLGGHSVNAARLFALVERDLHITAPLAALYEAPTPRKLASVLAGGIHQDRWQSLVPIRAAGSRIPLFLMHGAEGNVLLYRALASHLGENQPVYGLQSAGLDGRSAVDGNIVRVARKYVEEIRTVQPEGPYMLGGYCLGGLIAMEMARQLIQDGQPIGLLAMIENFNIRSVQWPLPLHVRLLNRLFLNPYYHLQNILEADGASRRDFFRQKLNVEIARAKVESRILWGRVRRALNMPVDEEFHHLKIANVWDRALEEHEVVPYPGQITLFTTERSLMGMSAPQDGWTGLALGGIREFKMPFSPKASMTEPYVRMVAQRIRACMDDATARSHHADDAVPVANHVEATVRL